MSKLIATVRCGGALLLAAAFVSCSHDSPTAPATGSAQITVSTTGANLDAVGYTVSVDGGATQAIGVNATLNVASISPGPTPSHLVAWRATARSAAPIREA